MGKGSAVKALVQGQDPPGTWGNARPCPEARHWWACWLSPGRTRVELGLFPMPLGLAMPAPLLPDPSQLQQGAGRGKERKHKLTGSIPCLEATWGRGRGSGQGPGSAGGGWGASWLPPGFLHRTHGAASPCGACPGSGPFPHCPVWGWVGGCAGAQPLSASQWSSSHRQGRLMLRLPMGVGLPCRGAS